MSLSKGSGFDDSENEETGRFLNLRILFISSL
jgi:hypothetical protein